jgi:hypothetical protein
MVDAFRTENIAKTTASGYRDAEHTSLYHTFGG